MFSFCFYSDLRCVLGLVRCVVLECCNEAYGEGVDGGEGGEDLCLAGCFAVLDVGEDEVGYEVGCEEVFFLLHF